MVLIGCALMTYNWARFGSALEFGQKYQLAGVDNTKQTFFGVGYFWYHVRLYLWEPVQWSTYFPFVLGIRVPPAPAGQLGVESVFGVLTNLPIVWLAWVPLIAPGFGGSRARWHGWLLAVGLVAAICGLTVCFFGGATNRYFVDFLPAWILLAGFGVLRAEQLVAERVWMWRWPVRWVWVAALGFSVTVNFFASCEHLNLMRLRDPAGYRGQARFWNTPVAWWESWTGAHYGPLELRLKLPAFTKARTEPLLMTGYGPYADYLWIHYDDAGHVRIGVEHTDRGGAISPAIPVDYGKEHTVVISMGSLFPPDTHPWHGKIRSPEEAFTRQMLSVRWDNEEVLRNHQATYDASPATRYIGETPGISNFGVRFSGIILTRRILDLQLREQNKDASGRVILRLRIGPSRAPSSTEPLVQTGETGKADTLFMRFVDERSMVLGLDHWGYGGPVSAPLVVDHIQDHELEVQMGSLDLRPVAGPADAAARRRFLVRLDGQTVLETDQDFYPAKATQMFFGLNPVGASMLDVFAGKIVDVRRGEVR
jgi:hypothetical protein